jgi:CRISP-associated protein Cas1
MLSDKPKEILHSKRGNLQLLEHCRVLVKGGRVQFLKANPGGGDQAYWNIPIANTYALLLGTGTSITQRAVRMLSEAGVMIGFCGGDGTPLLAGTEIEWIGAQSEYRPTEYVQSWMSFWFDPTIRLEVAKRFVIRRTEYLVRVWGRDEAIAGYGFDLDERTLARAIQKHTAAAASATDVTELLAAEGQLTKSLYKHAARLTGQDDFVRDSDRTDLANRFLSHGNYLAYGAAATCLWCLGIPHGFAVMHGKTRRGALVFDVADLIKDAVVLPLAFLCAAEGTIEQDFRQRVCETMVHHDALDRMFEVTKEAAAYGAALASRTISPHANDPPPQDASTT